VIRRTLARSPGFTLTATLVAALGIGATTAAFSMADHVLVRPLPFPEPDRIVRLWQDQSFRGYPRMELSPANYRDWARSSTSVDVMAAYRNVSANLVDGGEPQRLDGAAATADLFTLLGVEAAMGRVFSGADDREGAPGTIVLSHGLWTSRFGGDADVVGRSVVLDGEPHTIIGVMQAAFHFPSRVTTFWKPMRFAARDFEDRTDTYLHAVGRLRRGVTLEQARAEMRLIAAQLEREHPEENARTGATVHRLRDAVSERARLLLAALAGASLCVLLIACTNLANLLLARALGRQKELAIRTVLGAGRPRLVRQMLTESLVLAAAGGTLGVVLAMAAMPLSAALVPNTLPIAETPALDLRVLALAAIVTAATGIGFGVVPALRVGARSEAGDLVQGARAGASPRTERLRSTLVVAEVTAAVVLVVCSGLLLRAMWRVQQTDPGFRAGGVLTLRTALPMPKYEPTGRREQFYRQVLSDIRSLPGVEQAAYISFLPMVMRGGIWSVTIDGQPENRAEPRVASLRFVTPGFFATVGTPLLRGRDVSEADTGTSPFVAVVSESFARQHWPGVDPIGRRVRIAFQDRTVVGVAGDIRVRGLEAPSEPQVYLPSPQVPDGGIIFYVPKDLVVRASVPAATLVPAIRGVVARADPQQPISDVRLLADIVDEETAPRRAQVRVLGAFASLAFLLAAIGIHGLLAFSVSSRVREIGIRVALGARPGAILALVVRRGAVLALGGVILGVVLAYAAGRMLQAVLAGVGPADAATFLAATLVSLVMTLAGTLAPALRAIRVDPVVAMRVE
jgi:predicted permease